MTPLTRKENYLNEIVGWGETAPEKPLTPEEFFFAAILGEAVQTPEPLSRYQIYLAKIAGRNISVPKPLTRLEHFLARAAGMEIETPTPITREEMFWADYALIELNGIPPLTFKSDGAKLKSYRIYGNTETLTRSYSGSAPLSFQIEDGSVSNYRIYGNTVNGESVGDRTENLWDENYISASLQYKPIYVGDGFFTLSTTTPNAGASGGSPAANIFFLPGNVNSGVSSSSNGCWIDNPKTVQSIDGYVTIAYKATESFGERYYPWNNKTMLNVGFTTLPYEPYGYRIPITNNSETANIYLDAPLTKQGDNADYIDYAEQKRYNADGTNEDVSLPSLPAQSSTNSLSVGTAVQPSSLAVDVDEVVSCGDKITDSQSVNYGKYKIPVILTADSAETTEIYLDTPLAKSENSADYIDYVTQKRHNSDGTESNITLPEIAVTAGTNTLTVGTEVQPSGIDIKGRIQEVTP